MTRTSLCKAVPSPPKPLWALMYLDIQRSVFSDIQRSVLSDYIYLRASMIVSTPEDYFESESLVVGIISTLLHHRCDAKKKVGLVT